VIHFTHPQLVHLFWIVPAAALFLLLTARRSARDVARVTEIESLNSARRGRKSIRSALLVAGTGMLIFSLTGPAWNPEPVTALQEGRDVVFAVDVSKSMRAQDLVPDRLERAKLAILDMLPSLSGDRVAVVAFAGGASLVCPLTRDYAFFRWAVERLSPSSAGQGGTMLGDAIRKVTDDVFDTQARRYKDLVLISDGEDQESFPVDAAAVAARAGIRIIAIGLGDPVNGSRIPVANPRGERRYLTDQGVEVVTYLRPETLRQVAAATPGGRYLHAATSAFDMGDIYRRLVQNQEKRSLDEVEITRYQHKYHLFLGAALVLLLAAMLLPESRGSSGTIRKVLPAAAVLAWFLWPASGGPAPGGPGGQIALGGGTAQVRQGNQAFTQGDFKEAAARYSSAREKQPGSPEPLYNLGVALYRQGNYQGALSAFRSIRSSDRELTALAIYNQGLALARIGQQIERVSPDKALELYTRSEESFQRALQLQPGNEDAAINIEVARTWIERARMKAEQEPEPGSTRSPEQREPPGKKPQGGEDPRPDPGKPDQAPPVPDSPAPDSTTPPMAPEERGEPRDETARSIIEEEERLLEKQAETEQGQTYEKPTW
jgi:Ca-activated chloride channel family protein